MLAILCSQLIADGKDECSKAKMDGIEEETERLKPSQVLQTRPGRRGARGMRLIQSRAPGSLRREELTQATSPSRCVTLHGVAQIVHPGLPGFGEDSTRWSQGLLLALAEKRPVLLGGNRCRLMNCGRALNDSHERIMTRFFPPSLGLLLRSDQGSAHRRQALEVAALV